MVYYWLYPWRLHLVFQPLTILPGRGGWEDPDKEGAPEDNTMAAELAEHVPRTCPSRLVLGAGGDVRGLY